MYVNWWCHCCAISKDDKPSDSKRSCIDPQQLDSELENEASDLSFESDDLPLSGDVSKLGPISVSSSSSKQSLKQSRKFNHEWQTGRHWLDSKHDQGMSLCKKYNKRPFNNDIWSSQPCTRTRNQMNERILDSLLRIAVKGPKLNNFPFPDGLTAQEQTTVYLMRISLCVVCFPGNSIVALLSTVNIVPVWWSKYVHINVRIRWICVLYSHSIFAYIRSWCGT